MSKQESGTRIRNVSLDTWAVIFSLGLAVLVRLGALKHIPW
jgi:hypothetical protein